jgi:hypothetical protein
MTLLFGCGKGATGIASAADVKAKANASAINFVIAFLPVFPAPQREL